MVIFLKDIHTSSSSDDMIVVDPHLAFHIESGSFRLKFCMLTIILMGFIYRILMVYDLFKINVNCFDRALLCL